MMIGGLQKSSLIDYPGHLSCVVFTVGCNFRCQFCHNKSLVTLSNFRNSDEKEISEEKFFEFLKKRQGLLDGVCITGGEPTLHPDLPEFIQKIKDLGYSVKLDTNGTSPEMLVELFKHCLVDYVAMDLKTSFDQYGFVIPDKVASTADLESRKQITIRHELVESGASVPGSRIVASGMTVMRSIDLILKSGLPFEFRTTIVPGLHTKTSLIKLAKDIKKAAADASVPVGKIPWYLQNFRSNNCLDSSFNAKSGFAKPDLLGFIAALKPLMPQVTLR